MRLVLHPPASGVVRISGQTVTAFVMGLLLLLLSCSPPVLAQTQRGQIVGEVTDATGAVVPGARIELTDPATGVRITAETNASGLYTIPYLQYGKYELTVSAKGFSTYTRPGVEIATSTTTTVNVTLSVGEVSEQVTVQASGVVLEANTSSVGTAVEEKLKSELPNLINGDKRSAFSYIYLSPTVNSQMQLTIGGSRSGAVEVLIDGQTTDIDSNFMGNSGGGLPSVESIGEFKLHLNSMAAEYGRSSGGEITYASKSGTNAFHGVGYEYLRNHVLDARPWQAAQRDVRKQNEYGFAGGGPVIIPKLYNGRNKTFFWGDYTGYKLRAGASTGIITMPTPAMRRGDYSEPGINPIFDILAPFQDAEGRPRRQQFPGNIIPASRLSSVSKFFIDKLPQPNRPGPFLNYNGAAARKRDSNDVSVKVDHYLNDRNRIAGFYQWTEPKNNNGNFLGDLFGSNSVDTIRRTRLEWAYNIRPNLIHQALYGFTRHVNFSASNNYGQNLGEKAGLRGYYDPNCPDVTIDRIRPGGTSLCSGDSRNLRASVVTTFNDSLLWSRGTHTVKMGLQFIRWNSNVRAGHGSTAGAPVPAVGLFRFFETESADTNFTGGNGWASFALGYPQQVFLAEGQAYGIRESYYAPYVQDDWRISRKLTVNMGLRWDINVPYNELQGLVTGFNHDAPNPRATGMKGTLEFFGKGPGRNGIFRPGSIHWKYFGPRLGMAYQIDSKTVFRAFGGMIHQGIQSGNADFADRTGFFGSGIPKPPVEPFGLFFNWDNPFPQDVLGQTPNTDPAFRNDQSVTFQSPQWIGMPPSVYMWSAGFQREMKGNILLELTYLSNNSKHGNDHQYINALEPRFWSLGQLLLKPLNSPEVQAAGFKAPYPQFNTSLPLFRALLPRPQFVQVVDDASPTTSSTYHAAYIKAQKRFSSGLTFLANYTVSKYLSDTMWAPGTFGSIPRDFYNRRLDKGLRHGDMPHRVVLSYSYELPFGPGKKLAAGTGTVGRFVLGGWTVSGIHQYQSGPPAVLDGFLSIPVPLTPSITTSGSRADRVLGVPVRSKLSCGEMEFGNPAKNYLFNAGNPAQAARTGRPLAFQPEGDFKIGNTPNTDPHARQCPTFNEDISIAKYIPVRENLKIRFGADMFNIFNRHSWESGKGGQDVSGQNFGVINVFQIAGPRQVQMNLRIEF